MDEIVIKVTFDPDNGGYSYYVYDGHDSYMECEELDGGVCTTTLEALNMAPRRQLDPDTTTTKNRHRVVAGDN